jgi:hypothetical protein
MKIILSQNGVEPDAETSHTAFVEVDEIAGL